MVPVWLHVAAYLTVAVLLATVALYAFSLSRAARAHRRLKRRMRQRREQTVRAAHRAELDGLAAIHEAAMDRARDHIDHHQEPSR